MHTNVWWWPFERWHQIKIEEVHQKFCPRVRAQAACLALHWLALTATLVAGRQPAPGRRGPDFRARARTGHQDHQGQVPRNVFSFVWNDYHLSFPLFFWMTKVILKVIYHKYWKCHQFWKSVSFPAISMEKGCKNYIETLYSSKGKIVYVVGKPCNTSDCGYIL